VEFCYVENENGESVELGLKLPDSQAFAADFGGEGLAGMHQRLKAINDRWVNAINSGGRHDTTNEIFSHHSIKFKTEMHSLLHISNS